MLGRRSPVSFGRPRPRLLRLLPAPDAPPLDRLRVRGRLDTGAQPFDLTVTDGDVTMRAHRGAVAAIHARCQPPALTATWDSDTLVSVTATCAGDGVIRFANHGDRHGTVEVTFTIHGSPTETSSGLLVITGEAVVSIVIYTGSGKNYVEFGRLTGIVAALIGE
ncbi:MAG: hypothetical protein IT340_23515 [Chloroflexi bacterium]|nr:hypothetical protein [Chloroflexota bacterium]